MAILLPKDYKPLQSNFFHAHAHSNASVQDGMNTVESMVERAARYNQPSLVISDHGVLSGAVQLYTSAKKHGIKPGVGIEAYIIDPAFDLSNVDSEEAKAAQRYHLGIIALDLKGYQGLVGLSTLSYTRPRYHKFPRLLVDDLLEFGKEYGQHIAVTTGCVFGFVEKQLTDNGIEAAVRATRVLQQMTPNLYVEIQKHNIPDGVNEMPEGQIIDSMLQVADKLSLPIMATADCHYLDQSSKESHTLLKRMLYNDAEGKEAGFPGDAYHLASSGWMREKWEHAVWDRFEESYSDLLGKLNLVIPQLEKFTAAIPEVSKTPDTVLYKECNKELMRRGLDDNAAYIERLNYELEVIKYLGMANYFLLVLQCVKAMIDDGVPIEARGSANGSLVLYLLKVTQVDPIIWGTSFDRFMAKDRIGAPDVDIDIADQYRWIILDYLASLEINGVKYKTSQIGTLGKLGQSKDSDTGSAFNTYKSSLRITLENEEWALEKAKAEAEGRKPVKKNSDKRAEDRFRDEGYNTIKTLDDVQRRMPEDYRPLKAIIEMNSVYKSRGKHAGGILVSSEDVTIEDFIPQMMAKDDESDNADTFVTQFTMKDVEQLGLLKMDWLGQTSMTVMSRCMEYLGKDSTDFSWIPNDDDKTLRFVSSRKNHVGLFHLENYPKSIAMVELAPKSTADFVIHQAYSMPGAADSGAKEVYLNRRRAKKWTPVYTHPILVHAFADTNGVMIYQEQPLEVGRAIGMNDVEITNILKVMKDSGAGALERNKKRLAEAKPRFWELADQAGFTEAESKWFWQQMLAMAGYGFSINHSVGYGIRSYRTAYLKRHHPLEYMGALLNCWAGKNNKVKVGWGKEIKKEDHYLDDAKKQGLRILPAVINKSQSAWTIDKERNGIRRGYMSLPGIGAPTADSIVAGQPYTSMEDFCTRSGVSGSKPYLKNGALIGVVKTLTMNEAFNGFKESE